MSLLVKRFFNFYVLSLIALIAFTACSRDDSSLDSSVSDASFISSVAEAKPLSIRTRSDFEAALSKLGVKLDATDLDMLKKMIKVKPISQWTPGPENNSAANMQKHFLKHGADFKPPFKNENDYLRAAVAAFNSVAPTSSFYLDLTPYKESKIISVAKWDSKSYEFTVVRQNGQTATYFLNNKLKSDRFVQVPSDMAK